MIIGITGGIGSGKSAAADYFKNQGFAVIDSDEISRKLTEKGSGVLPLLALEFGSEILESDGSLNRKALAAIAFSSKEKTEKLNSIMHGKIYDKIKEDVGRNLMRDPDLPVFVEVPLLFEVGWQKFFDRILLVTASEDVRIARVIKRDGLTKEQVLERMSKQMKEEEKVKLADFVVYNDGDFEELNDQLKKIFFETRNYFEN